MKDGRFIINRRAMLGYNSLTPQERDSLETVLAPLTDLPIEQWPAAGAKRLSSTEPLFLLHVNDSLRAFVRPTPEGRPEVMDIVAQETLEQFRDKGKRAAGKA